MHVGLERERTWACKLVVDGSSLIEIRFPNNNEKINKYESNRENKEKKKERILHVMVVQLIYLLGVGMEVHEIMKEEVTVSTSSSRSGFTSMLMKAMWWKDDQVVIARESMNEFILLV